MICIAETGLISELLVGIAHPKCRLTYRNEKSDENSSMTCFLFPRLDEGHGHQPLPSEGRFFKVAELPRAVAGGQTRVVFPFAFSFWNVALLTHQEAVHPSSQNDPLSPLAISLPRLRVHLTGLARLSLLNEEMKVSFRGLCQGVDNPHHGNSLPKRNLDTAHDSRWKLFRNHVTSLCSI